MNFPVGQVILKGALPKDFVGLASSVGQKKFNGYIVQTIRGRFIEEGVVFFREGEMVACIVECPQLNKNVKGKEALEYFFNQTKAPGFFHVVGLTRSQIDLITAFDEKLLLIDKITLKDVPKLIPLIYSAKFEAAKSQKDYFEEHGLSELRAK